VHAATGFYVGTNMPAKEVALSRLSQTSLFAAIARRHLDG
jgi:hypothetical protein